MDNSGGPGTKWSNGHAYRGVSISGQARVHLGDFYGLQDEQMRKLLDKIDQTELVTTLDRLSSSSSEGVHIDLRKRRLPGTGRWLLENKHFVAWKASECDSRVVEPNQEACRSLVNVTTLWCPGLPGAGKTFVTSIVIDDLLKHYQTNDEVAVTFLYSDYQKQHEQSVVSYLLSVARQLVARKPSLIAKAIAYLQDHNRSTESHLEFLAPLVEEYKRVFIVMDALDEFSTDHDERMALVRALIRLRSMVENHLGNKRLENHLGKNRLRTEKGSERRQEKSVDEEAEPDKSCLRLYITSRSADDVEQQLGISNSYDELEPWEQVRLGYRLFRVAEDESEREEIRSEREEQAKLVLERARARSLVRHRDRLQSLRAEDVEKEMSANSQRKIEIRPASIDIERMLDSKISASAKLQKLVNDNFGLRHQIVDTILEKSDRIFLLAARQLDDVRDQMNVRKLKSKLENMTGEMDTYYELAVQRIHNQHDEQRDLVLRLLTWILHARRQLSIQQMQQALALECDTGGLAELREYYCSVETLVSMSEGLAIVTSQGVAFAHETVQAFFRGRKGAHWTADTAYIAQGCLKYLMISEIFDQFVTQLSKEGHHQLHHVPTFASLSEDKEAGRPLFSYLTMHWTDHVELSDDHETKQATEAFLLRVCTVIDGFVVLGKLITAGCSVLSHRLISSEISFDFKDPRAAGVLLEAVSTAQETVVRLLLAQECDVNSENVRGDTALVKATTGDHGNIVRLLLQQDDLEINRRDKRGRTILFHVAPDPSKERMDHDCDKILSIATLLLAVPELDVEAQDIHGRTALSWIASAGYDGQAGWNLDYSEAVVEGGNTWEWDLRNYTPYTHHDLVELLLRHPRVRKDAVDDSGRIPLDWAKMLGRELFGSGAFGEDLKFTGKVWDPLRLQWKGYPVVETGRTFAHTLRMLAP